MRIRVLAATLTALTVGLALPACDSSAGDQPSTPAGAASGATAPTTARATTARASAVPTADAMTITMEGVGPYRIGTRREALNSAGLLGDGTAVDQQRCPELYTVQATGEYAGTLLLVLRHNMLIQVGTAGGKQIRTGEGAGIGQALEEVDRLFDGGSMESGNGGARGFAVQRDNRVLLFTDKPTTPGRVGWLAVGLADHTLDGFRSGKPC